MWTGCGCIWAFGLVCEWVRERFGACFQWDLSETELRVIACHLHRCPQCAKAWRKTEKLLEQLEALSPIGQQLKSISSEHFMAHMMARIDRYEAEQASKVQERRQGIGGWVNTLRSLVRMLRFATALLLLLSVSALAYLGPQV